jgi:hypothetical protein
MTHDMGGAASPVMIAAMTVMMLAMAGFSLAHLARAVPATWRARLRHTTRRSASLPAATGKEGTR